MDPQEDPFDVPVYYQMDVSKLDHATIQHYLATDKSLQQPRLAEYTQDQCHYSIMKRQKCILSSWFPGTACETEHQAYINCMQNAQVKPEKPFPELILKACF